MVCCDLTTCFLELYVLQGTGRMQPSKVLKGPKSAVVSEAVYQSYEGYFSPANMVMCLLEVDSLTTDEGGIEVVGKSHVLVLHL